MTGSMLLKLVYKQQPAFVGTKPRSDLDLNPGSGVHLTVLYFSPVT